LAILILPMLAVLPPVFAITNTMYVSPATVNGATYGYLGTFTVTVYLDVAANTNSWQTYLTYNKNHLA